MRWWEARGTTSRGRCLGWEESPSHQSVGFSRSGNSALQNLQAVIYDGDAPVMTFGTTGSGKGRGNLIPNALLHDGSLIAIDPKGTRVLEATKPLLRLLITHWIYDPLSRTLVTSDMFSWVYRRSDHASWAVTADDDPSTVDDCYATTASDVLQSTNGGDSWTADSLTGPGGYGFAGMGGMACPAAALPTVTGACCMWRTR